ncbi:MAG: chromate efflux transporter [Alphaproteobacteria bacterium]
MNELRESAPLRSIGFGDAFKVWLRIGLTSFGGPAGQIALMHKLLVEERRWIGEKRFLHALNYCMLLPGPEAQQLATYIGWLLHRTWGGIVAGTLFVLPGALVIWLLSVLYTGYKDLALVQAIFFGVKAAVLAVVIEAVHRIGKRVLKNGYMIALAAAAFIGIFAFDIPFPIIVLAAGAIGYMGGRFKPAEFVVIKNHADKAGQAPAVVDAMLERDGAHIKPSWRHALTVFGIGGVLWFGPLIAITAWLGWDHVYAKEGWFFSKMAVVTFGGAYAVLAYVAQEAVQHYHWLAAGEMLDGLGLAETTPGPLILVLQFVGFVAAFRQATGLDPVLAGTFGALLVTWVTFVPCFMWIFIGAPYVEALRGKQGLSAALSGITAAVVGVILNLAVWFGLHVLFGSVRVIEWRVVRITVPDLATLDPAAAVLAVAALIALLRFKIGMLPTLGAAALLGVAWRYLF